MENKSMNSKIEPKSTKWINFSDSTKMGVLIRLLELLIQVGKHSQIISISMASLNLTLAVNDFISNNIGFAILNSVFALVGVAFTLQMRRFHKIHSKESSIHSDKINVGTVTSLGRVN